MGNICGSCGVNEVNETNIDDGLCTDCLDIASEGKLRPTQELNFHEQGHRSVRFNSFPVEEMESDYEG